jgi:DNA-binding transcriptional ArsR family regulator
MLNRLGEFDRIFHALADPSRRSMVERLARGPASVSQLAEPLAMSLAAVVQHLGVLEEAGIVVSEKVGRVRTCRLEPTGLRRAEDWLSGQRTQWELRLDRLGEVLTEADDHQEP